MFIGMNREIAVKVKEINIERGNPTAETAVRNMVSGLHTAKGAGYKAVILVHGYGSSGVGGTIKNAARAMLNSRALSGIVRDFTGGENWFARKREFTDTCRQLKDYNSHIDNNKGITVILLK